MGVERQGVMTSAPLDDERCKHNKAAYDEFYNQSIMRSVQSSVHTLRDLFQLPN
jgi:hypothetical protein